MKIELPITHCPLPIIGQVKKTPLLTRGVLTLVALLCPLIVFDASPAFAQRAKSPQPAKPPAPAAQSPAFEKISAQANQQREAGNFDEAIKLYQQGVAAKPRWEEGWWYLATLLYEQDRYEEAVKAFSRVAALQPKVGAPVAMQGLCEYRLGRYDDAFLHLQQGRQRGVGDNQDLARIMRFHEATLFLLRGDFETAQRAFHGLATEGSNTQDLMIGLGLSILRISALPKQIDLNHRDRDLIRRAGLAQHYHAQLNAADSRIEFERLAKDFPATPNVQYAYGRFLIDTRDDDTAIAAFEKEIANSPSHALARLQIAYIKLRNKDPEAGIKLSEEAVRLTPRLPLGHYVLGRCLFETGENKRAIEELEIAQRMAPSEARVYYVLARAYAKANRKEDAERARETFARLDKANQDSAQRGDQRGDAIEEKEIEKIKP
ncbi:MAG: tetratricopeptide repeat protein [Blastocatellia bacterium]